MENKIYRFVDSTKRKPDKSGMFICHLKIMDDGFSYYPASYCKFDSVKKDWVTPSANGIEGVVLNWLEEIKN